MHIKVPTLVIGYLQDSEEVSYLGNEGSDMQGRVDVVGYLDGWNNLAGPDRNRTAQIIYDGSYRKLPVVVFQAP